MALLNDQLTVWEIAHRWAGYDLDKIGIHIPLEVRDNFRCMIYAILHGYLECGTLLLERWGTNIDPEFDKAVPPEDHIQSHFADVMACINGEEFDEEFLRHAIVERDEMQEWCERMKISLPEFWFPRELDWRYNFWYGENGAYREKGGTPSEPTNEENKPRNVAHHRIKMACQQIAISLWAKHPKLTNKEIAVTQEIQQLGGGSKYELETIQLWLSEIDPRSSSNKRGPKRKNNTGSENSGKSQPFEN